MEPNQQSITPEALHSLYQAAQQENQASAAPQTPQTPHSLYSSMSGQGTAPAATVTDPQKLQYQQYADSKVDPSQVNALNAVVQRESGWNPTAQNPTSTAYGIGQFLDSTWQGAGSQKTSDPYQQINAMLAYIGQRYGTPEAAQQHEKNYGWY